ncbi:hypothetical protein V5O48_003654 [Marasmius crinis-equi]|uniref:Alpha/beta hydrolase fold-3 domain-containing protein n=1 Tax=Marasmius crinis-equi TaxID=585013 RepID=A0ABR3FSA9_9AGAR
MAEYSHLSTIDPEFAAAIAKVPPPPPGPPNVEVSRAMYRDFILPSTKARLEGSLPSESELQVKDHQIDVGGGAKVRARSLVPTPKEGEDGWTIGNLEWDDYPMRKVAVERRIAIVSCEYRLAPEHPFPASIDDAFAGLKFVASNPGLFSASLSKGFLVGGASAGGNLAAVLSQLARDDPAFKSTPLTGQFLVIPVTVHPDAYPEEHKSSLLSYEQNKDAPTLTKESMDAFWKWYNPPPTDPKASPLLSPSKEGLPPAFFQVAGMDPLRDEGLLYEKLLRQAGVKTKLEIYPGVPHGFMLIDPTIKAVRKFEEDFRTGITWLLEVAK